MLNIISYHKNANQNQNEIMTLHLLGWLPLERDRETSAGEDVEKMESCAPMVGG